MNATGLRARARRAVAVLLAALLAVSSTATLLHAAASHDADFAASLVLHDASQHRVTTAPADAAHSATDHCSLCHSARVFRPQVVRFADAPALASSARNVRVPTSAVASSSVRRLPARAPPASALAA